MPRIAMIQMLVRGNQVEDNLGNALQLIKKAAAEQADLAVLPECMDIGWTHPGSQTNADTVPGGKTFSFLQALAIKHKIFICSGLTERDGDRVYNTAVLLDDQGRLLLKHRKINELDIGKPFYSTGDRLNVVNTPLGRLGVMICADALPEDRSITTALARMEPQVILSPCAWAVPPGFDNVKTPYGQLWRDAYMPVAKEFKTAILGVSNVGPIVAGPWQGWDCIGASLAINNRGEQELQCSFGVEAEEIVYVNF